MQGGEHPKQEPAQQRKPDGENQDAAVEVNTGQPRDVVRRQSEQDSQKPIAGQHAGPTAQDRKEDALGQQLPRDSRSSRSNCEPDSNLMAAPGVTRKQ